ncbi:MULTISPECIES: protein phosphatase CheZ [Idiomarina]|jgi:chemotaxis protein CheZ|uniref:Protein phosphatase CheZ n=1 Tax=Idiomarina zobellii TaxID=86103 RepID=A0A837NK40_9GAMM|nr:MULTISPECIES: protein phosphatase CheZ [Idiomarina]KTG24174.1 protein phosphatase [Idiomarina sp. H105]MCH2455678.1 protein phosphatase CheZ [Idiomarina sp.]OAE91565.1 protein phosphatase [Idiomarina sp. WRN-38]KPD24709.1 protein phosphatase [Idiomarina zobellii]WPZ02095.1 protein phosphatase CheZ [Idiomarina sp. OXR-189]|tara:strand:- start:359 stop:1108 length:750 start_codon:yes stop_codon:yes gene_type:complete
MSDKAHDISLEQAKELVSLLEEGKQQQANQLLEDVYNRRNDKLFTSVGQLTRDLHEALQDFQLDPRIVQMTEDDLPDAQNRLQYVIQKTEDAANRTMDAVEACLPMADDMHQRVESVMPVWNRLMSNDIQLNEFKSLCHEVDDVLKRCGENMPQVHGLMTEVLMAQDYQDITGQVIRRVIQLVEDVEKNLIELLKIFGKEEARREAEKAESSKQKSASEAEGPIIDADKRDDVVGGQDEVDDLLSSLGF